MTNAVVQSGDEDKQDDFNHDQGYRYAAGEKYLAGLDNYDRNSWIDPYKMFDYDTESVNEVKTPSDSKSVKNSKRESTESVEDIQLPKDTEEGNDVSTAVVTYHELELRASKCGKNEYVYITRWLRKFLRNVKYSPEMNMNEIQTFQFSVVNRKLYEISELLESKEHNYVQDVDDIFSSISAEFHVLHPDSSNVFSKVSHFMKENSVIVFTLLASLFSLWYIYALYDKGLSLRMLIIHVCLASIIWTWIHMYQKEIANKHATLDSLGYPVECQLSSLGFWSFLKLYYRQLFELQDNCAKYYEAQIVDPFWKISPLMVVSETLSNFVLQPLGSIARHSNTFIRNLFSNMPVTAVIPILLFLFFLLLMLFKYKLRLPFFFLTLEPSIPANNTNRIEYLPFPNAGAHAVTRGESTVEVQPSATRSPQHTLHDVSQMDFNGSGDYLQGTSPNGVQQNRIVISSLKIANSSTETNLDDNFSDTEWKVESYADVLSDSSIIPKASSCLPGKVKLKDQCSQTEKL